MVEVRIERCLGRTEADRKITSEPWSSSENSNGTDKTTPGSGGSSVLKKDLTGPTLLEMSGNARLPRSYPQPVIGRNRFHSVHRQGVARLYSLRKVSVITPVCTETARFASSL